MVKVLVADDSVMLRRITKMILEEGGHTVVEATDGGEAIAKAKAELPQIVLLDAEMPEVDGWEACKAIKADPATANIPVLMCTGHDLSEEPELLTEAGANGFLTKPYNPSQMLDKIKQTLGL